MSFQETIAKINSHLTNKYRNKIVNGEQYAQPRFELYHAAPSLCSMKCRTVLAENNTPYLSHDMNIMIGKAMPEHYLPDYVRMRLLGAPDEKLVQGYTGQSSVTTEGFDPCVVPTLIDHEKQCVVVDSSNVCAYLNTETTGRLIPPNLSNEVEAQVAKVDQAPHVASLYGAHPDHDRRPKGLATNIAGVHAKKITKLKEAQSQAIDDAALVAAYDAKIAKEAAAGVFVFDADQMRAAHRAMDKHIGDLEQQLSRHNGPWAFGNNYTMADVMWTCSLFRMKWLGLGGAWENTSERPRVQAYALHAFDRPSFRTGVIEWPFAYFPSPHVPELSGFTATLKFFVELIRRGQR